MVTPLVSEVLNTDKIQQKSVNSYIRFNFKKSWMFTPEFKETSKSRIITRSNQKNRKFTPAFDSVAKTTLYTKATMNSDETNNNTFKSQEYKKMLLVQLWKFSVNFCDILGLLDILPCGTIHSVKPYIHYSIQVN